MFENFWNRYPALLIGLNLLLGSACALSYHPSFILGLAAVNAPILFSSFKGGFGLVIASLAFFYALLLYPSFDMQEKKIEGNGLFHISSVTIHQSPFQKSYLYKGLLKEFCSKEGKKAKNLPVSIYVSGKDRPPANIDYTVEGMLQKKSDHVYLFKPIKKKPWQSVQKTYSFAEWRYDCKQKVCRYLKTCIKNPESASFLAALATGNLEDRTLSFDFGRVGLQHLLAISGFHFALLALFFGFFLRLVFSPRLAAAGLMIILSAYFFFLGNSPSVQRAALAIFIFLFGYLFNLKVSGLNALGAALVIEIAIDPLFITHVGFQLSFLCTTAILVLFGPINRLFSFVLPNRPLKAVAEMNLLNQHGYILSALIRNALALNISVHLAAALPLLYLFHKIPLLSFLYNLFFPFLTGIALLFLLTAFFLHLFIPPLGLLLHALNNIFTSSLLQLTAHPPIAFDYCLRVKPFPFTIVVAFLCLYLFAAIYLSHKKNFEST